MMLGCNQMIIKNRIGLDTKDEGGYVINPIDF